MNEVGDEFLLEGWRTIHYSDVSNGTGMNASAEIRKKLALLIGSLIDRCMREARLVPHILNQDEVIHLLVDDPALYERLVLDEQSGGTEHSKKDLTVKIDMAKELERMDRLEAFDKSFWDGPEVDLAPVLDLTNQLTRTFAIYLGNASTLFDREFDGFMNKFRQSMLQAGMTLRAVDFSLEDVDVFETNARTYLRANEFLNAFTFDRLLSSQIMLKQVVNLPATGFSLRENLIRHALKDPVLSAGMIRFILRISYVSQGAWKDLFSVLARLLREDRGLCSLDQLTEFIEQDVMFSCNLLCRSYSEIRELPAAQRRSAIANALSK